jgi:hypothetical protein
MKRIVALLTLTFIFAACNNQGSENRTDNTQDVILDSGGQDTMYYERMQQKTGAGDSINGTPSRSGDTMYYERLQNKTNPPDSGRNP